MTTWAGQVAAEFMLYTAVFMLIAVAAFLAVNSMQQSDIPLQQNTLARETGQGFVTALTLAVKGGTNFTYTYRFPKNIFGKPYTLNFNKIDEGSLFMEWTGDYGQFSYMYGIPAYDYEIEGDCMQNSILTSSQCTNVLELYNDGETLHISQLA